MSFSFDGGGNAALADHPAEDSNYYYSPQDNSVYVKQVPISSLTTLGKTLAITNSGLPNLEMFLRNLLAANL
jgi:hypothetical protein